MQQFLHTHRRAVVIISTVVLLVLIVAVIIFMFNPFRGNDNYTGPTGGGGSPEEKTLVLSGWDTQDNQGRSLSTTMDTETQNHLVNSLLDDYTTDHKQTPEFINGAISDLSTDTLGDTQSFRVTIGDTTYTITYTLNSKSVDAKRQRRSNP